LVNYDPIDKTVLANEQVDAKGCSWRSGAKVEKKMLKQWFFKISAFRKELLQDLDDLAKNGAWPERIITMQKNWLGKSIGACVKFKVTTTDMQTRPDIEVFTTRPDTLYGVQYVALASSHPIVQEMARSDAELQLFLDEMPGLPEDSKAGYMLSGVQAINPLASEYKTPAATKASLPIYVAPYVLGDYGDGAVMGVPGHDPRDYAFWKYNRNKDSVRTVIVPLEDSKSRLINQPYTQHGKLTSDCGPYAGRTTADAAELIVKFLKSKSLGSPAETWRLRDWLISRQRYWGTPIPIIHCETCGPIPVPEDQLPVKLPYVRTHWKDGKVGNPLENVHAWVNTPCPRCHAPAKRDTDTMDTFVDSSWYFMRFIDPKNEIELFSPDLAKTLLPVDVYVGGVEHAILHLLYARFISKFIASTGHWKSQSGGEPFKRVLAQGMVHGKTYTDPSTGRFLKPDEVDLLIPTKPKIRATGETANISFEKMSKSKYNGIDPGKCIAAYGADATRAHMLFQAPVSEVLEWDEDKILGITRWMQRITKFLNQKKTSWVRLDQSEVMTTPKSNFLGWDQFVEDILSGKGIEKAFNPVPTVAEQHFRKDKLAAIFETDAQLWRTVQTTIGNVTRAYSDTYSLNTVVSDLMSLTNAIEHHANQFYEGQNDSPLGQVVINYHALKALIQMMAPIMPAFAEECWTLLHPNARELIFPKPSGIIDRFILFMLTQMGHIPKGPKAAFLLIPRIQWQAYLGSKVASVFDYPFPEQDGMLGLLRSSQQKCAVQVNGKMKIVVKIPVPPENYKEKELENWIVDEIYKTKEGTDKLSGKMDVRKAKKVIVVQGGKVVNFVM